MSPTLLPVLQPTPLQAPQIPVATRVSAQRAAARRALRRAAGLLSIQLGVLRKSTSGAPRPCGEWHYSLSHCRSWVCAVLHRAPVGIDVERVQHRRARLVERVLNREEVACLGSDALSFTRAWTAKEALLKRAGVGLAELSACRILAQEGEHELWLEHRGERHLVRQRQIEGHILSLHAEGSDWQVDWSELERQVVA